MAQSPVKRSNNIVMLGGKSYYIHIVRKGETLFSISQAYEVPVDTIKKDNMHLTDEIGINQFLKIRINESKNKNTEQKFIYHKVVKGDTPTNLALRYKSNVDDIYKFNPNARLGIFVDEIIKIPYTEEKAIIDTVIDEKKPDAFIIHIVEKKQTIYGLAILYKTSKDAIEKLNPQIADGRINPGDKIKIPVTQENMFNLPSFYLYQVQPKETEYGITHKYNLRNKDLKKLNPILKERGLQVDEWIRIPKNEISDTVFAKMKPQEKIYEKPAKDTYSTWQSDLIIPGCQDKKLDTTSTYKVAFFMPFYLNINDTLGKFVDVHTVDEDGVEIIETLPREGKIKDKIYPRSLPFIEFYQGALLAINDLKENGISFEIHIFDTQNDSLHTKHLLETHQDLQNFDLFIGPMYGDILKIVGDFAWENQINIVSPLSQKYQFIDHNPYAFQVSPPFDVQMHHASDFLNQFEIKNYIVIHDGNNVEQDYIALFKKQLFAQMTANNFNQIKYNEVFYYDAQDSVLKEVFTPDIENIVIVPSSNQAFVTDVMGKLNGYSYQYNITTFGQPRWMRFDNIELENFHHTKTHLFSNSFINYHDSATISFVRKFRTNFSTEPKKISFQGYDITRYFLLALNKYGKDFRKCIHMHKPGLLQTQFNFVPYSEQGGYQNTAIFILEYSKDYKLHKIASYPKQ